MSKSKFLNTERVIEILDKYIEALRKCEDAELLMEGFDYIEYLSKMGLIGEYGVIVSDPFYDTECIGFARSVLEKVKEEVLRDVEV